MTSQITVTSHITVTLPIALTSPINDLLMGTCLDVNLSVDNTQVFETTYVTKQTFEETLDTTENMFALKGRGLKIMHLNIQHLLPKLDELKSTIFNKGYDIIGFSETFLNEKIPDDQLTINGFSIDGFRKDRQRKTGGGLVIYVADDMSVKRRKDLESSETESIWLEVVNAK